MAARLRMSSADYLAIAVTPALIMALVGSLVFFLIEVLYVGGYQARLTYIFAWFVFATVLIARISIEFGSARAAMFSLPLGLVTFLAMLRFVEHQSIFSPLINAALMAVVWWCAHRLTWDCTLIDDDQDATGEGLLQRIGIDDRLPSDGPSADAPARLSRSAPADQPPDIRTPAADQPPRWLRWLNPEGPPHTPGLSVLYFSLAALPLFGIGQWWIPAADAAGRRYAFALLVVYVAAALSLLVMTSFLGLRRYLRQRRVEMPEPMALTWVALGAALIFCTMLLAALVPRPAAEYAISRTPWAADSPDGQSSWFGWGSESADQFDPGGNVDPTDQSPEGDAVEQKPHEQSAEADDAQASKQQQVQQSPSSQRSQGGDTAGEATRQQKPTSPDRQASETPPPGERQSEPTRANDREGRSADEDGSSGSRDPGRLQRPEPLSPPASLSRAAGFVGRLLKYLFYLVFAALVVFALWKYRRQLATALRELLQELKNLLARLFGRESAPTPLSQEAIRPPAVRHRRFSDFSDPFQSGRTLHMSPQELVRYTFEAFEAWAADQGTPRRVDQTPAELARNAVARDSPLYDHAGRLVRLYGEVAYGSGKVPARSAERLREMWQQMEAADRPRPQPERTLA